MGQERGDEGTACSVGGWLEDVDFGFGAGYGDQVEDVGEHSAVENVRDVCFSVIGYWSWSRNWEGEGRGGLPNEPGERSGEMNPAPKFGEHRVWL